MHYLLVILIAVFILIYRLNKGNNTYKFLMEKTSSIYEKIAPYSFKKIRKKVKDLGQDFSTRQYLIQVIGFAAGAFVISYLYFYNIVICIIYSLAAISLVPYLAYLRYKKIYSDFIFEQIQVYTSNVIMEFQTVQSFVTSIEGVIESEVIEDPVRRDLKQMVSIAYEDGIVDNAIKFFNEKYEFHIVKNMHQLFMQITKEGAKDTSGSLENMLQDIDMLVEGVYRDRMDRAAFHRTFLQFGILLYLLIMLVQFLLTTPTYITLIENNLLVKIILHVIIIVNTGFLINGEKFYYENVGAE